MKEAIDLALTLSQDFFGEAAVYTHSDNTTKNLNAIFLYTDVEVNGVSSKQMTCEILASDLSKPPAKGDKIVRGPKTWNVGQNISQDEEIYLLILKD